MISNFVLVFQSSSSLAASFSIGFAPAQKNWAHSVRREQPHSSSFSMICSVPREFLLGQVPFDLNAIESLSLKTSHNLDFR